MKKTYEPFVNKLITKIKSDGLFVPPVSVYGATIEDAYNYDKKDNIIKGMIREYENLRPAFWISKGDEKLYAVELYFDDNINLAKYNKHIMKGRTNLAVIVIDCYELFIGSNVDKFDLDLHSTIETSYNILLSNMVEEASKFRCNGEYVVCPASQYKKVFKKSICKKCPFLIKAPKNKALDMECFGKTCIRNGKDIKRLISQSIKIVDDDFRKSVINQVSNPESSFYADIKDRNASLIDEFKPEIVIDNDTGDFGRCPTCNRKMELAVGWKDRFNINVEHLRSCNDNFAYSYCPVCHQVEPFKCPICKRHFKLLENERYGRIFLACEGYASPDYREDVGKKCMTSLTLYTDRTCKEKQPEFREFGSLTSLKDKKKFKKQYKLVEDYRESKRKN